jgi:hypothetical protein
VVSCAGRSIAVIKLDVAGARSAAPSPRTGASLSRRSPSHGRPGTPSAGPQGSTAGPGWSSLRGWQRPEACSGSAPSLEGSLAAGERLVHRGVPVLALEQLSGDREGLAARIQRGTRHFLPDDGSEWTTDRALNATTPRTDDHLSLLGLHVISITHPQGFVKWGA